MSKELVISASSHERRVAILEEGQLVEIYIEREKEFALVGSIYKGKVTRVLPGMQSAFVDIGLDGDAFLYVSDVFENLEDYDHEHPIERPQGVVTNISLAVGGGLEILPGETLHHAEATHEETAHPEEASTEHVQEIREAHHTAHEEEHHDEELPHAEIEVHHEAEIAHEEAHAAADFSGEPHEKSAHEPHAAVEDERQPDSNASAPQNFSPRYNPTQNYSRSDRGNGRGGQNFGGRGGDRDRGGNDRGGRGRWGRRGGGGGRHRGGRHQGPAGRNLPPSKYASPQGSEGRGGESRGGYEQRGYENRGQQRGYDNRRGEGSRHASQPPADSGEEPIVLPGESLAKYRDRPAASASSSAAAGVDREIRGGTQEAPSGSEETSPRTANSSSSPASGSTTAPRRFSGGLPRWLLAEGTAEAEGIPISSEAAGDIPEEQHSAVAQQKTQIPSEQVPAREIAAEPHLPATNFAVPESEHAHSESDLSEDQVAALASEFVEAKHEEAQDLIEKDPLVADAQFEEEEETENETLAEEEAEELEKTGIIEDIEEEEETEEVIETEEELEEEVEEIEAEGEIDHIEHEEGEPDEAEVIQAVSGEPVAEPAIIEEEIILLPGETRAPRTGGPREEFRDSARIGGNPRARFQRPFRSGGRDRGGRRDNRGGGRSDRRGGDRGPRRFDRRGPGGGGHGHHRGHGHHHGGHSGAQRRPQLISEMLKAGQDVVVQIAKEPLGKKGARITSHVALPGRFLVYMPTIDHIGVSRKIASAENRSRLRRLVGEARGSYPGGFIVRTAAGAATDEEIRTDIEFLGKTWADIKQKNDDRKAPALLHRDLNLVERILRDYVSDDFTGIWIDNEEEYGKVVEFVSRFQPKLVSKVKLYSKDTPIFEEFGIQHELDKALRAKVWLKSGGYIVINHTEALVAIDVNTGKFVGKGSTRLEDTIVKTNLEAVKEIVRQIRLRDLGGIIVVDFIDMEERRNREKVLTALQQALEQDKAPSKALSFNEFGLVCITRKRTKQALERVLCQPCPYCTGSGMVKSVPTLCYEIQAEARKMAAADHESPNLTLRVHPEIAKALKTRESMLIDELEQNAHKHVIIQSDATLHWEQYDIY